MPVALEAAEAAGEEGWDVEVVDLRTIVPFDDETVVRLGAADRPVRGRPRGAGLRRCRRRDRRPGQERCFHALHAPVLRVTGFDIPYPPPKLEHIHLPGVDRVLDAVARLQWDDLPTRGGDAGVP